MILRRAISMIGVREHRARDEEDAMNEKQEKTNIQKLNRPTNAAPSSAAHFELEDPFDLDLRVAAAMRKSRRDENKAHTGIELMTFVMSMVSR